MCFVLNVIACMDTPVQTMNYILPTLICNMTVPIVWIGLELAKLQVSCRRVEFGL